MSNCSLLFSVFAQPILPYRALPSTSPLSSTRTCKCSLRRVPSIDNHFPLVLSTSVSLPSKETSSLAPQRGQCWRLSPRFKAPSSGVRFWRLVGCLLLTLAVVWKRDKNVKYLGSVHGEELAEFYGVSGNITDKVALDSVREFCSQNLRECCDEAECYPA